MMFKDVPLININTKDINVKIPALTSEEINKYGSYLQSWIAQNQKIVDDRASLINQLLAMCGTVDKAEAKRIKDELTKQMSTIDDSIDDSSVKKLLQTEINNMQAILNLTGDTTRQEMGADYANI